MDVLSLVRDTYEVDLARYIVHVNFIKISPMKYHVRVNPKSGMFFKTFLICSQYF